MTYIASWIIFGILTGLIARFLDPKANNDGILGPMLLGVVGAVIGAVLANTIFGIGLQGLTMNTFAIASAGSLILLFIGRLVKQA